MINGPSPKSYNFLSRVVSHIFLLSLLCNTPYTPPSQIRCVDINIYLIFAAFGSFCDALMEYVLNIEQSPDPTIALDNFYIEIGMAYDVLFSSWLHSKEPKLVESVLYSLSSMFPVLSAEKVTAQTGKIVLTLLNLYKKHAHIYYITKCLGSVIFIAARTNGTLLEPLLTNILHAIGDVVCISPDYAQPDSLRSHSEVLRCYECLATHFTDHTVDYVIAQLKNNNEKERIRALLILAHLTNSAEAAIHSRSKDLVRHLYDMLSETNMRVKKALLKAIIAFSCKGFLMNKGKIQDGLFWCIGISKTMRLKSLNEESFRQFYCHLKTCSLIVVTASVF